MYSSIIFFSLSSQNKNWNKKKLAKSIISCLLFSILQVLKWFVLLVLITCNTCITSFRAKRFGRKKKEKFYLFGKKNGKTITSLSRTQSQVHGLQFFPLIIYIHFLKQLFRTPLYLSGNFLHDIFIKRFFNCQCFMFFFLSNKLINGMQFKHFIFRWFRGRMYGFPREFSSTWFIVCTRSRCM